MFLAIKNQKSKIKNLPRLLLALTLLALAWFTIHLLVLAWVGVHDDTTPTDVGVVLGNYVAPDGTTGPVVRGRLDRALELYRAGAFKHIIVSGGFAPGISDEPTGMRRYLVEQGVPEEVVVPDYGGANTFLTALNARRLMRENGWKSATVISQYYHILRCRLAFSRMGLHDVRNAHTPDGRETREPYILFREFVAFYWYLVRSYPGE